MRSATTQMKANRHERPFLQLLDQGFWFHISIGSERRGSTNPPLNYSESATKQPFEWSLITPLLATSNDRSQRLQFSPQLR